MPKMTKAAVKKKYKSAYTITFNLFKDKLGNPDSNVNISKDKLMELHNAFVNAFKRMK